MSPSAPRPSRLRRAALPLAIAVALGACSAAGPSGVRLVPRAEWGAAAPTGAMKPHEPVRITIHHTATPQRAGLGVGAKLQALQRFSQSEGELEGGRRKAAWADVPYHYYIAADGTVGEGREVRFAGDSNTPYDPSGHLLIVVEGNFENETPTAAQWSSLVRLTGEMARRWRIPADRIAAHRDFADTLCPGRTLYAQIPVLREYVERSMEPG